MCMLMVTVYIVFRLSSEASSCAGMDAVYDFIRWSADISVAIMSGSSC